MTNLTGQLRRIHTVRATKCRLRANIRGQLLQSGGYSRVQLTLEKGTTQRCPPGHTRVTRDLWGSGPSIVEGRDGSTLQEWWVVPNPQHLLLTLFFETSMHEEKCPL